ncbi:MAG: hypothetical protein IKP58_02195 [Victivallales bacterium]|nr:hypothetical protein [Victivallales bacterium]
MAGRKLAIGYHAGIVDKIDCSWSSVLAAYRESVAEVFFTMPGDAAGVRQSDHPSAEKSARFFRDLERLRNMGIVGVLLFDASCYGGGMVSKPFFEHIKRSVQEVKRHIRLKAVVTMTPPMAEFLKGVFPELEIRASVNEQVGSMNQLEYAGRYYDGFYLKRDMTRDVSHITKVRKWCDEHKKTLHLVPNNGCLYECPFMLEHLNVMGHAAELAAKETPWKEREMQCREALSEAENRVQILQGGWIRPEDIAKVEGYFDTVALLSSDIPQARKVLDAYVNGHWDGDLLELLEPCHAGLTGMPPLRNNAFPDDWFEKTSTCGHACDGCGYCRDVLGKMAATAAEQGR